MCSFSLRMLSSARSSSSSGELDLLVECGNAMSRLKSLRIRTGSQLFLEVTSREIVTLAFAEVVLYDAITLITHSGDPNISTPSNILINNPRSILIRTDVDHLKYRYRFPSYIKVCLLISYERID